MRKNSKKNTRINGEVKKELSVLITREIKDPRINPLTSVLDVEVAPDLKTAKVYVSVMGDDESRKTTLQGLKSAAPFMRSQLARNLNLRNTPELTFIMDNSIEYGINMSKLIDELNSKSSDSSDSTDSSEDDMDDENKYDDEYDDEEDDE
ncbi:MAG: 30S ribosome-binding factor RbfA [Clostridiales bacterium]|nr:30S ribosome-binding factor RbfA [Clostridiales bacterium]